MNIVRDLYLKILKIIKSKDNEVLQTDELLKTEDFKNVFSEYKVSNADNNTNILDKIEYRTIRKFGLKNFKIGFKNGVEYIKLEGIYGNRFNSCILNCSTFEIIELNLEGSRLEDIAPFVHKIYNYTRKLFLEYILLWALDITQGCL